MAQSYTTQDGVTLIIPGTVVATTVQTNQGAIASAGVLTLIGEADEGPGFLDESDLSSNAFTPDQFGKVLSKYGSGRLVDAFNAAVSAANDPNILGAVSLIRLIKTNMSQASSGAISRSGFGTFATSSARRRGLPGNLIRRRSEVAVLESAPTTGLFRFAPALTGSTSFAVRANGGAKKSVTATAKMAPSALQAAIEDVAKNILALGGEAKSIIPAAGITLSAAAPTSSTLVVTLQAANLWIDNPAVGDVAIIPLTGDYGVGLDSVIAGTGNDGAYIITAITNTLSSATLTLKKVNSSGALGSSTGSTAASGNDILIFKPLEIRNASGQDRGALVGADGTYNVTTNDGSNVVIELPSGKTLAATPAAGDWLRVESTFAGVNAGHYQVISATTSAVTAVRVSTGSSGAGAGSQAVAGPVTSANQPFQILRPVIDGVGKTLSIEGSVSAIFVDELAADAGLSNDQIISASEYKNQMTFSKSSQSESFKSGGDIVMSVGCSEESATMEISTDKIDFKVSSTLRFSAPFAQFKTVSDLAAFVSSQTNFSASVSLARLNSVAPSSLDEGTFGISGLASHKNARIKKDAFDFAAQNAASSFVSIAMAQYSGLPEAFADTFMSGGTKAGTTSASVTTAIDAVEKLSTNFIVPLFSVDSSVDLAAGETESSSTYTVDAVNAYLKSHVIKMSAIKLKKNRLAIASKQASYDLVKEAAGELSSFRVGLCFQDIKAVSADGTIKTFQPWMASVVAAGMQAAAGYKGIVKKFANVSGIAVASGDFDANGPGDAEDALKAGLLFMERVNTGGFRWVSDQQTYSVDNNFVYNSMQAVYLSDLVTLTLIERFDRLVVGRSVAEISAASALSILEAEMFNFKRIRWISASDDAPKGYKNASAKITGPVLEISAEIKLAGLIYFVPIAISLSQVTQSAEQK